MELEQEQSYKQVENEERQNGRRSDRLHTKQQKTYDEESQNGDDSGSDFQQVVKIQNPHLLAINSRPKRTSTERNYKEEDDQFEQMMVEKESEPEQEEDEQEDDGVKEGVFHPEISQIIWKREKENTQIPEYLVKYKSRSYIHVEWLTDQDVIKINIFLKILESHPSAKQKYNRFNKTFEKKLLEDEVMLYNENQYFDPSYLEPDRILSCAELFPLVHPKKGGELKGRWCDLLQLCISKMLNFSKSKVKYGVYFMEPVNPDKDGCPNYKKEIPHPMDLGTINNRIYLGCYKDSTQFWQEVGLVFKNCRKFNKDPYCDIRRLCDTLRECCIVLYTNWHEAQKQRYLKLHEQRRYIEDQEYQQELDHIKRQSIIEELQQTKLQQLVEKYSAMKAEPQSEQDLERQFDQDLIQSLLKEEFNEHIDISPVIGKGQGDITGKIKAILLLNNIQLQYGILLYIENFKDHSQLEMLMMEFKNQQLNLDRDYELFNPNQLNFSWLQGEKDTQEDFINYKFVYLNEKDITVKLSLNTDVDKLYLVKWKNLSYQEATWEQESKISTPSKIMDFRQFNRSLDKDTRGLMLQQNQRHQILLDYELGIKKKKVSPQALNEMRNQLYFYGMSGSKEPPVYVPSTQPIYKERKLLRDYQLQSLNWLIKAWYEDRNVILADEMGLGKTIQSIALLNHLHSLEGCRGPFLVVAPLSTLTHWKRTVEDWTNMNAVLYYDQDGADGRSVCRYYEWFYTEISTKGAILNQNEIMKFQILITSYEVFLLDINNVLINIPFQYIVIDEAHRLKNQNARILQNLKKMPCKRILLLTGTPVQNNTDELFSLLNFIEPKVFPSGISFSQEYGDLKTSEQIDNLSKLLKPYILRRQKEDVEQEIPPLSETIIDIEMTTIQKTLYKALYERNKTMLLQGFSQQAANATQLNNLEIQLRKCCNHPFLIKEMNNELTKDSKTVQDYIKILIESSGKMILLDKLLKRFKDENKKVLIFSQFTYMLLLLEDYLRSKAIRFEKIDGQIKAKDRQNAIDRFNDPTKKRDVFLLSTKAGGQGINLTAAEVVIIYDSDWNPQNDVQATARAHRIGQCKEVTVFRLITKNTYESEMFERATKKLGLDQAIFMGGSFKRPEEQAPDQKKLSKSEIEILLKKGILGLVENEDQNKEHIVEENIDAFLEKNSRQAKYSLITGSYTIQKQSFVSEKTDQNLQIEDPNFWQIILKNTESKTQKLLKQFQERQSQINSSIIEQRQLMLNIADCVNSLVDSKLSHQGFNADDEKNISDLLNQINLSRYFSSKLKEMATNWLYEIYKPSRRFKKITNSDLQLDEMTILNQKQLKAAISNGKQPEQKIKVILPFNEGEDAKRLALKSKEELLKKLCYVCERPQCSYFCMGHCRRAFHEQCKNFMQSQKDWINIDGPKASFLRDNVFQELELKDEDEQTERVLQIKYVCCDCSANQVICHICKKKGSFFPNETSTKLKVEELLQEHGNQDQVAFDESNSPNDNETSNNNVNLPPRQVKKVKRTLRSTSKFVSELSKCSTANCNRYFHLECIKNHPNAKLLDQSEILFRCPAHVCAYCNIKSANTTTALMHCVRCCRSFHLKCASPEAKRKLNKIGKKVMLCDQCNKNWKNDTLIKIQLEPLQTAQQPVPQLLPQKQLKQSKLAFKAADTVLRFRRQANQGNEDDEFRQLNKSEESQKVIDLKNLRKRKTKARDLSISRSPERIVIPIRKRVELNKKVEAPTLTYEDFGITSVKDFDYSSYTKDWCKYCGARFASNFTKGPWGSRTLCTIHYINWGQKKTLDLSGYPELPSQPINRDDQTELQFLQRQKLKDNSFDPHLELGYFNEPMYKITQQTSDLTMND